MPPPLARMRRSRRQRDRVAVVGLDAGTGRRDVRAAWSRQRSLNGLVVAVSVRASLELHRRTPPQGMAICSRATVNAARPSYDIGCPLVSAGHAPPTMFHGKHGDRLHQPRRFPASPFQRHPCDVDRRGERGLGDLGDRQAPSEAPRRLPRLPPCRWRGAMLLATPLRSFQPGAPTHRRPNAVCAAGSLATPRREPHRSGALGTHCSSGSPLRAWAASLDHGPPQPARFPSGSAHRPPRVRSPTLSARSAFRRLSATPHDRPSGASPPRRTHRPHTPHSLRHLPRALGAAAALPQSSSTRLRLGQPGVTATCSHTRPSSASRTKTPS
jgi:hypothetical protein